MVAIHSWRYVISETGLEKADAYRESREIYTREIDNDPRADN